MADPPPVTDFTNRSLGDFTLLRKLGQGGMGQVYLARQVSLKRDVAVKILRDELASDPTALKRFQAEAEAVARISHPNIVQVYAVGEADGVRYMALEYVNGRTLRDFLDRKGPPELPVALSILRQIAAALQRAGELGLVHRDIKPENVLLTRKAEVKVTDFGLSRYFAGEGQPLSLTQSGMTLGTPLYMSPEQVQGKAVDHRSDLYSFGVTAYHLLAGQPPFRGATAFDVAAQHVQAEPPPLADIRPDLPVELIALVHKLLAKSPDDRYGTAKDVLRDIGKLQKGLSAAANGTHPPYPASPTPAGPTVMTVTLSGSSIGGVSLSAKSQVHAVVPPSPARWPRIVIGASLVVLAGVIGWAASHLIPAAPASPQPPATVAGLPDIRPPSPVASARERELKAKVQDLKTKGGGPLKNKEQLRDYLRTCGELGFLYVNERRWDDADAVFRDLEALQKELEVPTRPFRAEYPPAVALARFGQAVSLAHQDKPADSNKLFENAIDLLGRQPGPRQKLAEKLFFEFPEFGTAIAEAVNRNADNLGGKVPPNLEWLRTPGGVLRGPKG